MFASRELARKIESAEANLVRLSASQTKGQGNDTGPAPFAIPADGGACVFVRPGSPMNKVIGVGFDKGLELSLLDEIERRYREAGDPVRFEVSTLSAPDLCVQLTGRGYRLVGFENVLGRVIADGTRAQATSITTRQIASDEISLWKHVIVEGFSTPDETGVVIDAFTRDIVEQAVLDTIALSAPIRYLAYHGPRPVGAASMQIDGDLVLLTGAATLPEERRRGAQSALLARRLIDARTHGARTAIITTAGGSRSQENAQRQGFHLLYARAILVREV